MVTHLKLSGTRTVEDRRPNIRYRNDADSDEEPWKNDGNEDDGAEDVGQCRHKHPHSIAKRVVYGVDIYR